MREEMKQEDPDLTPEEVPNTEPKDDFLAGELEDEPFSFAAPQIESPERRREMNYLEQEDQQATMMIEADEILNNIDDDFDDIASAVDPDFANEPAFDEMTEE